MAPLVSDCFAAERQFYTPAYAHVCSFNKIERSIDSYYLLTEHVGFSNMSTSTNIITYSMFSSQNVFSRQMSIISLANQMFKGSQPMIGRELFILKRTASRLISKTPTTLHKN